MAKTSFRTAFQPLVPAVAADIVPKNSGEGKRLLRRKEWKNSGDFGKMIK